MSEYIESNPEILGGKPVIKGTRIPLDLIYELVGAKVPITEILEDYPGLTKEILEKLIRFGQFLQKPLSQVDLEKYLIQEFS